MIGRMNLAASIAALTLAATTACPPAAAATPPAECAAAARALGADSADERERAARRLYERCDDSALAGAGSAAALRKAVETGAGAAAILLLGRQRDAASIATLNSMAAAKPLKLHLWSAPVPAQAVRAVALARAGQPAELDGVLQTDDLAQRRFLLDVLGEIEHRPTLAQLADLALADAREISGGLPSGARPRRRLCDAAVDAFATRLNLSLPFPLTPARRYTRAQLAEARTAILDALR